MRPAQRRGAQPGHLELAPVHGHHQVQLPAQRLNEAVQLDHRQAGTPALGVADRPRRQARKPTPAQEAWLDILAGGPPLLPAELWRPSDLVSGRIGRTLGRLARS